MTDLSPLPSRAWEAPIHGQAGALPYGTSRVPHVKQREATMPPRHPNDDENDEPEIEEEDDEDRKDDDPAVIREPDEDE